MDKLDAEMNVIADMLLTGHGIDYMAIREPERLKEILTERGVDLSNQAYVNEAGEYCIVDDLDSVWNIDTQNGAGSQNDVVQAQNEVSAFIPTDDQQDFIDEKRLFIQEELDAKRAEYDDLSLRDGVYDILADSAHEGFAEGARYVRSMLDRQERDVQNYINAEFADYPDSYREDFIEDQMSYMRNELGFYYDIVERFDALEGDEVEQTQEAEATLNRAHRVAEPQAKGGINDYNM